ncbi:DUF5949 family protein [Streptomyces sp. NPDC058067]|uniref:Uncharacterized protein n=1 Tax=Streptomyces antnestii TaxID=2494256 RepID=A0A437PZ29_9ACTN|nr:DUF5949 family protein [Streptomyces sp. San01]RVU27511.1 hypothetical protein EOT10_10160 [Streptomyces sp. San01]
MTSTPTAREFRASDLGTLAVIAWSGQHPDEAKDIPFLLAYSLGDGAGGREGATEAVRALLENNGLPVGDVVDAQRMPSFPVSLLVVAGQAVVSMPYLNAQCVAPPEWLAAAAERGYAYFVFTTRPWATAVPGTPVAETDLVSFAMDEATLTGAAHCLLPVRQLRA